MKRLDKDIEVIKIDNLNVLFKNVTWFGPTFHSSFSEVFTFSKEQEKKIYLHPLEINVGLKNFPPLYVSRKLVVVKEKLY